MQKLIWMLLLMMAINMGCASERCTDVVPLGNVTTNKALKTRVFHPQYVRYRNGRYVFVKGHYSPVIVPKNYLRRNTRGFMHPADRTTRASAR